MNDLRYACRTLRRPPWFVLTAILTLALGIGLATASTAVFTVADAPSLDRATNCARAAGYAPLVSAARRCS